MTWNTSGGKRFLSGAEAALFSRLIVTMIELFDDDCSGMEGLETPELNYGYPLIVGEFENLTTSQKFTVLHDVATALLKDTGDTCPSLNHVNEGAIYYVYRWAMQQFGFVESGVAVWGEAIIKAYNECFSANEDEGDDTDRKPTLETQDISVWKDAIERLADRILWDRDFEMYEMFGGGCHGTASNLGIDAIIIPRMGIQTDYYDASHSMFTARPKAKEHLYTLCNSIGYPVSTV